MHKAVGFGTALASAAMIAGCTTSDDIVISPDLHDRDYRTVAWEPAAAYNPNADEALVVFDSTVVFPDEAELRGQRVSMSTGALVGETRFEIGQFAADNGHTAAAYNTLHDEYLVTWVGLTSTDNHIHGQRLDPSGVPIGDDDFPIGSTAATSLPNALRLLYNPAHDEYLVVWRSQSGLRAQRLDGASGAGIGGEILLASSGATAIDATYTPGGDEYLVAWGQSRQDSAPPQQVWALRLDGATGTQLGSGAFPVSEPGTGASLVRVSFSSTENRYLVMWASGITNLEPSPELYGQFLDAATGAEVGTNDFQITSFTNPENEEGIRAAALAFDSLKNEFITTFQVNDGTNAPMMDRTHAELFAQRIAAGTGANVCASPFRVSDRNATNQPLAYPYPDAMALLAPPGASKSLAVWLAYTPITILPGFPPFLQADYDIWGDLIANDCIG